MSCVFSTPHSTLLWLALVLANSRLSSEPACPRIPSASGVLGLQVADKPPRIFVAVLAVGLF